MPASSVPGESASKTQPFPTQAGAVRHSGRARRRPDRSHAGAPQGGDGHRREIRSRSAVHAAVASAAPSRCPASPAARNWAGAAIDPETGMLYVGTYRLPFVVTVRRPSHGKSPYDFIGEFRYLPGPRGLPLLKPPFGSIARHRHEQRRAPLADSGRARRGSSRPFRQLGIRERLGFPSRSWALITKTVMIVVQSGYFSAPRLPPGGTRRIATSTISIRICGSTTRRPAKCWRRLRCRPTRSARR